MRVQNVVEACEESSSYIMWVNEGHGGVVVGIGGRLEEIVGRLWGDMGGLRAWVEGEVEEAKSHRLHVRQSPILPLAVLTNVPVLQDGTPRHEALTRGGKLG